MDYVIKDVPEDLFKKVKATAKAKRQSVSDFIKQAVQEENARLLAEWTKKGSRHKPPSPGRIFMNCRHDEATIGFCCDVCFMAAIVSAMRLVPAKARPQSGVLLKEFFRGKKPRWAKEFLKIGEHP